MAKQLPDGSLEGTEKSSTTNSVSLAATCMDLENNPYFANTILLI